MANGTRDGGGLAQGQRRARLREGSELARVAPHLAPEVLHRLIRHAGLDRCLDMVEALGREQLGAVLDLDLWTAAAPGGDEQFDADRFGEWVEALVDRDPAAGARVVARCDRSLVVTGLSRYVRVFDPGVLEPTAPTDDEPSEHGLFASDGSTVEVGGYVVQARREDGWDAIVGLLLELSAEHSECFHAVMAGCQRLSNAGRERDGLDDLLEAPDQLRHDVSIDRGDRRQAQGFIMAADARAFLSIAREAHPRGRENPIASAWLRLAEAGEPTRQLIAAEGVLPDGRARLGSGPVDDRGSGGLRPMMEYLLEHHPDVALPRARELAFLANTLVAGCRLQARSFTPGEASQAVAATCSLGLLRVPTPPGIDYLVGCDLIGIFEDGWAALHREVSLFVGEALLAALRGVRTGESETLAGLHELQRSLETCLAAGTPWLARDALDVLAVLDAPAWSGLLGVLSECPVIPDAVTATVERRTRRIDAGAFTFIATQAHIDAVRAFMARLPELLAG